MAQEPDIVRSIRALADPIERLRAATAQLTVSQQTVNDLASLRRQTIQELHDGGMSYAQIGEAAGISRGRIHQIKHGGPPPEAAFFGAGPLIIVTPLKREAIRSRPVVAVEDVAGSQRLAEAARAMGIGASFEHVPVDGDIDLNRSGLIVICGPRLSKNVAQVLKQDTNLQFQRADDGSWTLVDRTAGITYRSGADQNPPAPWDVAYLGRLVRPDGKGTLLLFTGIHPAGSLGVVHLLTTRLAELYDQVQTRTFSALVGSEHDPESNEPSAARVLTPLYELPEARP